MISATWPWRAFNRLITWAAVSSTERRVTSITGHFWRSNSLREERESAYVEEEAVRDEIVRARRLFERQKWPVIDVTRRSVEETAAQVINLLNARHGHVAEIIA